ncbi:MAG: hypothetical protein AB9903_24435 [Vulcanimicrobiota bacterium]
MRKEEKRGIKSMINLNMSVSPANYTTGQHQVEYSNDGKIIAQTTKDVYDKGGIQWKTARDIVNKGLEKIRNNEKTTEDEKVIATMGVDFCYDYMYNDQAARAMASVMNTVSSSMPGPIGSVLAKATLNSYNSGTIEWKDARKILKKGLETIASNPNTSNDEKAMANMGLDFGNDYMYNDQAARAQSIVVKTLVDPPSGPIAQVLAKTTLNSYNSGTIQWKDARKIIKEGLEAIIKNPGTSEDEKAIARMGIDFGDDYMHIDQAARIRAAVVKEIAEPPSGTMAQVLAKTTLKAYDSGTMQWKEARKIMREGFQAIVNNPKSSDTDKTLAQMGIDVGKDSMYNQEAAQMRSDIMQKIANQSV